MLSSTWATTTMRMSAVRGHGGSVCCWCDDRLVGESEGEELCSAVMVLEVVLTYAFLLILRDRWDGPFILIDKGSELVGRSDCYPTSYIREEDMKMQNCHFASGSIDYFIIGRAYYGSSGHRED